MKLERRPMVAKMMIRARILIRSFGLLLIIILYSTLDDLVEEMEVLMLD